MRFLPLAIDMSGRTCVVVGGGVIGTRKVQTLLRAGASVKVVAPTVTAELAREIEEGRVRWHREMVRSEHLEGACLVVMATDDPVLNRLGSRIAEDLGVLACDVSSSASTRVTFGALLEVGDVTIATFTDGKDPALARQARDEIGRLLGERAVAGVEHGGDET